MTLSQDTSQTYWNLTNHVLGQVRILLGSIVCFSGNPGYLTMDNKPFWAAPVLWNPLSSKLRKCSSVDAFMS